MRLKKAMIQFIKIYRIKKSLINLNKAERKLQKAKSERIWVENNPKIHILNYPIYKLLRVLSLLEEKK